VNPAGRRIYCAIIAGMADVTASTPPQPQNFHAGSRLFLPPAEHFLPVLPALARSFPPRHSGYIYGGARRP
jgi:hypothetical protein